MMARATHERRGVVVWAHGTMHGTPLSLSARTTHRQTTTRGAGPLGGGGGGGGAPLDDEALSRDRLRRCAVRSP